MDLTWRILVDEKTGNQIRSTIVRTLTQPVSGAPPAQSAAISMSDHSRTHLSKDFAEIFMNGPARFLLKNITNESELDLRNAQLIELFEMAFKMAAQLWSQKSKVHSVNEEFFEVAPMAYTEPHQSQTHLVEDDEIKYQKLPLGMVIQPAIVAVDTEDGEQYDKITRVWLKAQVWRVPHPTE